MLTRALRWFGLPAFCLSCVVTLLHGEVLPLDAVRAEDLASDYGLLTWNLWSTTESLRHGESPYFTRLLYHPLGSNLAAHTLGPGFAPLGLLARTLRRGQPDYPLYAHRLAIISCFTLGMLLGCLALRSLGASPAAALAASIGWAFAACWRLIVANQTLASACFLIPAVTLAVMALVRAPSATRGVVLAVLLSGGVYFSEYYSLFIAAAVAVVATTALLSQASRQRLRACLSTLGFRGFALAAAAGVLVVLPFLVAWAQSEGRPVNPRQVLAGGANLAGFFVPDPSITPAYRGATTSALHGLVTRGRAPFLGVPTLLLAAIGLARARGRRSPLLAVSAVFFLLSLGAFLKVFGTRTEVPLPYAALMHLPVLAMARDPQRLSILAVWGLLGLAALGLTALAASLRRRFGRLAGHAVVLVAALWWAAEGYWPGREPVAFSPPQELRRLPPGGVANVPLHINDGLAMFLQTYHGRPIVSGYVSRVSARQFESVLHLQQSLDSDARLFERELLAIGVRSVILQPGTSEATAAALRGTSLHVVDLREGVVGRD